MTEPTTTEQLLAEMLKEMREQTKLLGRIDKATRYMCLTTDTRDSKKCQSPVMSMWNGTDSFIYDPEGND